MKVKTNVWSCADEEDTPGLRAALRLVPSAANVPGWSYSGGKRRGVLYNNDKRCYEISDDPRARAATILHLAAVRGNVDIAVLVFSYGARVEVALGNPGSAALCAPRELSTLPVVNARDIAVANAQAGLISNDVLELFEAATMRQNSVLERLCEAESFQRRLLEMKEADALKVLEAFSQDGLVDVTVEVRGLLKRDVPSPSPGNANQNSADRRSRLSDQASHDGSVARGQRGNEDLSEGDHGEVPHSRGESRTGPMESLSRKQVHHIFIRRCASKQELQSAVERIVGQSCVISFLAPVAQSAALVDTSTESTLSPSRRRTSRAPVEKPVELHSRNIHLLLSGQRDIVCIARPLLRLVEEPAVAAEAPERKRKGTRAAEVTLAEIRNALDESRTASSAAGCCERGTPGPMTNGSISNRSASPATDDVGVEGGTLVGQRQRLRTPLDHVRDLVQRYDERHVSDSLNTTRIKQRISEEDEQRLLGQLYDASVKKEATRRAETQRYIDEGVSLLFRRPKKAVLTPELEESVARLSVEAVAKRAEKIAQLEAALLATVPRPPESTLAEEDRDAAKERLVSTAHREEVLAELRLKYHGDVSKGKTLSKDRIAACVETVYTKAIESKAAGLAKIEAEYGDFRARLGPGKKISKEEEVALATRLSKRE